MLYNAFGRCLLGGVDPTQMLLDRTAVLFLWFVSFFQKGCGVGQWQCSSIYIRRQVVLVDFVLASKFFHNFGIFPNFPVVAFAIAGF